MTSQTDLVDILPFAGLEQLPDADRAAVKETLGALFLGLANRDADALAPAYADDADWINAFGTEQHGRTDIVEYLRGLFADGNFNAGELVDLPSSTLRKVTDDVVVVSTVLHVAGQGIVGGGTIDRANHSLHVLARQAGGAWLIVSELFMDAREEETYAA